MTLSLGACSAAAPALPPAEIGPAQVRDSTPVHVEESNQLSVASGASYDPDPRSHRCPGVTQPSGEFFFSKFTMDLPPEVGEPHRWAKVVYTFEPETIEGVDCDRPGQRASFMDASIYRFQIRGSLSDNQMAEWAANFPNFRFYGPSGCDREKRECWRQRAPRKIVGEPVIEHGFQDRRMYAVIDVGGEAEDGHPQSRAAILLVERGAERYMVLYQMRREHWNALGPSVEASFRSLRFPDG